MSCRLPGAHSIEQFWSNLVDGVESITFFTDEDLLAAGVDPALIRHPDYVKAAPKLDRIDAFDVEIEYDPSYSWGASYRLIYVSNYGTTDYPYFSP